MKERIKEELLDELNWVVTDRISDIKDSDTKCALLELTGILKKTLQALDS